MGLQAQIRKTLNSVLKPLGYQLTHSRLLRITTRVRTLLNSGFSVVNRVLRPSGYAIVNRRLLYDWQRTPQPQPGYQPSNLPVAAASYLQPQNPRLRELQTRYASFNQAAMAPLLWTADHVAPADMVYFRGDNAYVWQLRGANMHRMAYALTTYYVKSIDRLGLLDRLEEDQFFGNITFQIDQKLISRDLLDSSIEIYFLERQLDFFLTKNLSIVDIGAGYGRLAHRMTMALPNIQNYFCTDAISVSTFIAEYYLRFRKLEDRAQSIPLDEIEQTLQHAAIDIAVNIHSFSECGLAVVDWWIELLAKSKVAYLMIVPNAGNHGGERLITLDGQDFSGVIARHGYRLIAREPKYRDPVIQQYAINPTYHYLFALE